MKANIEKGNTIVAAALLGTALAMVLATPAFAAEAEVTQQRLENADSEPQNWLTIFQNYSSHHFSRLDEINRNNVSGLKVAFTVPLSSALVGVTTRLNLENAPLVDDGFAYLDDAWGGIYKIDLRPENQGMVVWFADAAVSKDEQARTRGMALWGNMAFKDLVDGRVVAVDRNSGEFVWDVQVARVPRPDSVTGSIPTIELLKGEQFTAAPLAVEGKILVGQSFGDNANRGWLQAIDAATGDEIWRTYSIPGPGEPGHETWKDDFNAWKTGGGSLWTTGSYDPAQRVTIWGTANPIPQIDSQYRPGDNLYTNSALAFDIDDGSVKWYFQYTPNEGWDYDENGVHLLYDVQLNGQTQKVVGHFGRNGFFYQLNRTNGQFLTGEKYVDQVTWTAGLDPKTGKPVEYDPSLDWQVYIPETRWVRGAEMKVACPTALGGVRWQPPSYDPNTQTAYSGGVDGCSDGRSIESFPVEGGLGGIIANGQPVPGNVEYDGWHGGRHNQMAGTHGLITSMDVTTGKLKERLVLPYENLSGVTATAGGLLLTGQLDGAITAHDSSTLEELWRFNTRISIKAPVISYAYGGKQYIAVVAGGEAAPSANLHPELQNMGLGAMLYVFSL